MKQEWKVVVRRANGRFVKEYPAWSNYRAKKLAANVRKKMDDTYDVFIELDDGGTGEVQDL